MSDDTAAPEATATTDTTTETPVPDSSQSIGGIISLFRLDCWGKSMLNRNRQTRLWRIAASVPITMIYMTLGWSAFWVYFLNEGTLAPSLAYIPAIMGGMIFAYIYYLVDTDFVTSDSRKMKRQDGEDWKDYAARNRSVIARFAFILFGVFPISFAMDTHAFGPEISRHLRDEIRIEAGVQMIYQVQQAEARALAAEDTEGSSLDAIHIELSGDLFEEKKAELSALESQFGIKQAAVETARQKEAQALDATTGYPVNMTRPGGALSEGTKRAEAYQL
ncbi:MAG: hypothetical protein P8J32_06885, partial [bacterium]|nr:hypothetical protein [bacterium]